MKEALSLSLAISLLSSLDSTGKRHATPLREEVSLTLSSDRSTLYRGEPVHLQLAARNLTSQPVEGYFLLDPYYGDVELQYRTEGSEFAPLLSLLNPGDSTFKAARRTLAPGETFRFDVVQALATINPIGRQFLFASVGRYDLRAVFRDTDSDPNGFLESNVLSLGVVAAPTEEQSAQAAFTVDLGYVTQFRTGRSYLSPEITRSAADFIERFPESRYAVPVRGGLRRSLDYRIRTGHATDEERALFQRLFFDTVAPVLSVSASPASLWPPNHKLVPVTVAVQVSDGHYPSPAVKLASVTCDDACDPAGDIVGAALGTDTRQFILRAERLGSGTGRTYTITYSATDASGNKTTATTTVTVPHDQGNKK